MSAFTLALAWIFISCIVLGAAIAATRLNRCPGIIAIIALTFVSAAVVSIPVIWA